MEMIKCSAPLNVQFEVTYGCNNNCIFCYNSKQLKKEMELNTQEAISIIRDMASCGVMSINFNGGEPLYREDYFDIVAEAERLAMDIHMNTNAGLIDSFTARLIAKYFKSICTTVLSGNSEIHDMLSGRKGALKDAVSGIRNLQANFVYVAANIMLSKRNLSSLNDTFDFMRNCKIRSVLVTRYIPIKGKNDELHISDKEFLDAIESLYMYNDIHKCFDRISLPQPFPLCHAPQKLRKKIAESNIACNIGLCTASISPNGDLGPCNLVKKPVLGNLKEESFLTLWSKFEGVEYCMSKHLKEKCIICSDIVDCGGGCKGYNDMVGKEV